jgi:hypothetical protein
MQSKSTYSAIQQISRKYAIYILGFLCTIGT